MAVSMAPINTSPGTTLGGARGLLLLFSWFVALGLWLLCHETRGKGRSAWVVAPLPHLPHRVEEGAWLHARGHVLKGF